MLRACIGKGENRTPCHIGEIEDSGSFLECDNSKIFPNGNCTVSHSTNTHCNSIVKPKGRNIFLTLH